MPRPLAFVVGTLAAVLPAQTVTVFGQTNAGATSAVGVTINLPANFYRLEYVSGCYDDTGAGDWRADVSLTYTEFYGPVTLVVPTTNGSPPYASAALCGSHYQGAAIHFNHIGGPATFWIFDTGPGNNSNDAVTVNVAVASTAPPSYTGTGSSTTVGLPSIATNGLPLVGNANFTINCNNLVPSSLGILLIGLGNLTPGTQVPGAQLGALIHLNLPFQTVFLLSSPSGGASYAMPLPMSSGFAGLPITAQAIDFDVGLPDPVPVGTSRGMRFVIT